MLRPVFVVRAVGVFFGLFAAASLIQFVTVFRQAIGEVDRARQGQWLAENGSVPAGLAVFGMVMMYAFISLRRWGWVTAVVSSGLVLAFFTVSTLLTVATTGMMFVYGPYWIALWFIEAVALPVVVLAICLVPAVREAMVR